MNRLVNCFCITMLFLALPVMAQLDKPITNQSDDSDEIATIRQIQKLDHSEVEFDFFTEDNNEDSNEEALLKALELLEKSEDSITATIDAPLNNEQSEPNIHSLQDFNDEQSSDDIEEDLETQLDNELQDIINYFEGDGLESDGFVDDSFEEDDPEHEE